MNNEEFLMVWHEKNLVGKLWRNAAGIIGFIYEKSWIKTGFAISQQLPLTEQEYAPESGKAHQFFVNLLPEAGARLHLVRDLKVSNSDFELLKAIGGECAGALSILPKDYQPIENFHYKKITDTALKKLLLRKGRFSSITSDNDRPRLSLAGAQDKCPIFFDGENYLLPQDAAPSSLLKIFIIKK